MYKKEKFVQKGYKNEDFFFTEIYPKSNMNVVMVISPWE